VFIFSFITYVMGAIVLFEDLKGVEWITVLLLPVLFTLGSGLFFLFLPDQLPRIFGTRLDVPTGQLAGSIIKFLFVLIYSVGMYALLLTENIYSVAAIRTIQLLRAAHTVGFVITMVIGLFFYQAIFQFMLPFWLIFIFTFLSTLPLMLSANWSVQLKEGLTKKVMTYSLVQAWIVGLVAVAVSFWPVNSLTAGLLLSASSYVVLGLTQQYLAGRAYKKQIPEFVVVWLVVVLASFYVTSWR
jgi:hypothetical protein